MCVFNNTILRGPKVGVFVSFPYTISIDSRLAAAARFTAEMRDATRGSDPNNSHAGARMTSVCTRQTPLNYYYYY